MSSIDSIERPHSFNNRVSKSPETQQIQQEASDSFKIIEGARSSHVTLGRGLDTACNSDSMLSLIADHATEVFHRIKLNPNPNHNPNPNPMSDTLLYGNGAPS